MPDIAHKKDEKTLGCRNKEGSRKQTGKLMVKLQLSLGHLPSLPPGALGLHCPLGTGEKASARTQWKITTKAPAVSRPPQRNTPSMK